jgi:cutinase
VLARGAPPITIGQPYAAKTLQLCATGDPVCFPGGLDRAAHSSYKDNGMADQAADFATRQLTGKPSATVQQTAGAIGEDQTALSPVPQLAPQG